MSLGHGSRIVTDGLKFAYDMGSKQSWKGKPTTNYAVSQNAIQETSYAPHEYTTSGTWLQKHPNAIIAHNSSGGTLSSYVNTGVGDWTNTYHAHWQYDEELRKPVTVMEDFDGQWKAKSWGTGQSFTSMGLAAGDTYSISWLQWTDNLNKIANAGVYMRNSSGTWGFHAGQAASQPTAYNTKLHTWQRVYATFTVPANMNMTGANNIYMYGHYSVRATVKIADVQFETGTASGYSPVTTRAAADCLIDWAGGNTMTIDKLTYNSNGTFSFDGSTGRYINLGTQLNGLGTTATIECWFKSTASDTSDFSLLVGWGNGNSYYSNVGIGNWYGAHGDESIYIGLNSSAVIASYRGGHSLYHDGNWHHAVFVMGPANYKIYVDGGDALPLTYAAGNSSTSVGDIFSFGQSGVTAEIGNRPYSGGNGPWTGEIPVVRIYSRELSPSEIKQNFNATRARYGI